MTIDKIEFVPASDPGDTFEEECWAILRRRYRPQDLVYIPATMGGDYGIEGFSTDGVVYQCYADRDSLTLRHRTDKQKAKLSTDTAKLKANAAKLAKTLDDMIIEHYVLLVPEYHASELVTYAAELSKKIRGWGLSFVSPSFAIRIKTMQDYPAELRAALEDRQATALVPDPVVKDEEVDDFPADKPELVKVLDEKLAVVASQSSANVVVVRRHLIRAYLAKEQVMDALRDWPETWEAVERRRRLREETLELESELSAEAPSLRINGVIEAYNSDLLAHVGGLRDADARRLAVGQAGDWMMRCPLAFAVP